MYFFINVLDIIIQPDTPLEKLLSGEFSWGKLRGNLRAQPKTARRSFWCQSYGVRRGKNVELVRSAMRVSFGVIVGGIG